MKGTEGNIRQRETRDDDVRRNQELRSLGRIVGVSSGRGRALCWGGCG